MSFEEPAVVANTGFALSPEQLKAFSDQGFLKIDFGFDQQLLDQIVAEVQPLYGSAYEENPLSVTRHQDGWKQMPGNGEPGAHRPGYGRCLQLFSHGRTSCGQRIETRHV